VSVVIDASIAVKWVIEEARSDAAPTLRDEQLVAPELWLAEAANALWRHVRLGELTPHGALARMEELRNAPVSTVTIEPLIPEALRLATELLHPVYHFLYLALAMREGMDLITDDRRFAAAVANRQELAQRVRLLGA
jgi:predicted nucleic acid-binding protein